MRRGNKGALQKLAVLMALMITLEVMEQLRELEWFVLERGEF